MTIWSPFSPHLGTSSRNRLLLLQPAVNQPYPRFPGEHTFPPALLEIGQRLLLHGFLSAHALRLEAAQPLVCRSQHVPIRPQLCPVAQRAVSGDDLRLPVDQRQDGISGPDHPLDGAAVVHVNEGVKSVSRPLRQYGKASK